MGGQARTLAVRTLALVCALGMAVLTALAPAAAQDEPQDQAGAADKPADRVLGGHAASIDEFPWQVALVTDGQPIFDGQFCGGSVIAERWVLTAAHCAYDRRPQDMVVYWGSASLDGGGRVADVARIVVHPSYNHARSENDIALLQLADPITARPVRLPAPDTAAGLETAGALAVVTGWGERHPIEEVGGVRRDVVTGLTVEAGDIARYRFPTELQSVALPLVDLDSCDKALSEFGNPIDERVICAGAIREGVDACNGDSGGPLQVRDGDGRYVEIGLVSWGKPCSSGGFFNVYTRVSAFSDWIDRTLTSEQGGEDAAAGEAAVAATFGRIELTAGFDHDPASLALAAGGADPASRLGGDCAGYIASKPDVVLSYTAGRLKLTIAAASEADTTLVVLSPDGRISCSDDYEDFNPAVELAKPTTGEYRIWVGTYEAISGGSYPDATLFISELGARFSQ